MSEPDLMQTPSLTSEERAFVERYKGNETPEQRKEYESKVIGGFDAANHPAFLMSPDGSVKPVRDIRIFTEAEIRARLAELEAERGIEP